MERRILCLILTLLILVIPLRTEAMSCYDWKKDAVYAGAGMCFVLNERKQNHKSAASDCQHSFNGSLAELWIPKQKTVAFSILKDKRTFSVWLGASATANEGTWRWLSTHKPAILPKSWWGVNQPDLQWHHNCLQITRFLIFPLGLDDVMCRHQKPSICQKYIGNSCDDVLPGGEPYGDSCFKALVEDYTESSQAWKQCEDMDAVLIREPYDAKHNLFWTEVLGNFNDKKEWIPAKAVCQKVIPHFDYSYVVGIPLSARSVIDSALLCASHAHSERKLIAMTVVTSLPGDEMELVHFRGDKGSQYPLSSLVKQKEMGSVLVKSTEPLHVILVLWNQHLNAISSSLVPPLETDNMPTSMLAHPISGEASLCITTSPEQDQDTQVTIVPSSSSCDVTFNPDGSLFSSSPSETSILSVNLTSPSQTFCVSNINGHGRAPFVHSSQPVAFFITERQAASSIQDEKFEVILPTSFIGSDYVAIPDLYSKSKFSTAKHIMVAAFDDTTVQILGYTHGFHLEKAGDSRFFVTDSFVQVQGSKPFYLYAMLCSPDKTGQCVMTLLDRHLWTSSYTVHMIEPWTRLEQVYIIVVVETFHNVVNSFYLYNLELEEPLVIYSTKCILVDPGSKYTGCYFELPLKAAVYSLRIKAAGKTFAAYMYGQNGQAAACHQLGMNTGIPSGNPLFNKQDYMEMTEDEELDRCHGLKKSGNRTRDKIDTVHSNTAITDDDESAGHHPINNQDKKTKRHHSKITISLHYINLSNENNLSHDTEPHTATDADTIDSPSENVTIDITKPGGETNVTSTNHSLSRNIEQTSVKPQFNGTILSDVNPLITEDASTDAKTTDPLEIQTLCGDRWRNSSHVPPTLSEVKEMMEKISAYLRVDRKNTSRSKRTKESMPDDRVSSVCMAVFSCVLLGMVLGMVVLNDAVTFIAYLDTRLRGGRSNNGAVVKAK